MSRRSHRNPPPARPAAPSLTIQPRPLTILPRRRNSVGMLTATALATSLATALAGCTDPEPKPTIREDSIGLHAFAGCDPLLDYFHAEAIATLEQYALLGGGGDDIDIAIGGAPQESPTLDRGDAAGGEDADGPAFSNTNVQEPGIDEPDVVKTDGRHLYSVRNGYLLIHDAADLRELSRTALPGQGGSLLVEGDRALVLGEIWGAPVEDFTEADAVRRDNGGKVVLSVFDLTDREAPVLVRRSYIEGWLVAARLAGGTARVVVQSNPAELLAYDDRFAGLEPGGSGGQTPQPVDPEGGSSAGGGSDGSAGDEDAPEGGGAEPPAERPGPAEPAVPAEQMGQIPQAQVAEDDWMAPWRAAIGATTIEDWLPLAFEVAGETRRIERVVACDRVHRPGERAGFGLTSVISIDLARPEAARNDPAVVTGAGVVYAGPAGLYVATPNHAGLFRAVAGRGDVAVGGEAVDIDEPAPDGGEDMPEGDGMGSRGMALRVADDDREATQIHRFDIADPAAPARYEASGRVHGTPLNAFSLSEHAAHLRIATTERPLDGGETVNHLFVLGQTTDADGDATLAITGQITDLAPTEQIYAARFAGERGFLVTFRQVDPLFTLDLSDPTRPAVVGELKVPGFSTYLHPLGADHLIGLGQAADEDGRVTGMQLSLFDVTDFAHPALAHALPLGDGWSDALYDHHAFTYWAPESLLMVPLNTWGGDSDAVRNGLEMFAVDIDTGFAERGFIDHGDLADGHASIERSVVIGDAVYTVSATGMKANAMADLTERARALFPAPVDGPGDEPIDRDNGGREPAPAPDPLPPE